MEDERERWKEDERDERDEEDERDEMRREEAQLRNNQDVPRSPSDARAIRLVVM